MKLRWLIAVVASVLIGGVVLYLGITHIDAGHVGVEVQSCSSESSGIKEEPVSVGYHWTGPCTRLVQFPTYQQTLILTKSPHEGSKNDDSITVTSSEGLPINVDVSLSFIIDPKRAAHIYSKYRLDLNHIKTTYMRQTVREAMQETFSRYTAQQLYSDKREASRAAAQHIVLEKLQPDGFVVTQFTLNETRIPPGVAASIQAKVSMIQEAQRADEAVKKAEAEGRQAVAKATAEATAAEVTAKGRALVIRAEAEAEAWANERLAKSLSPALGDYMRAKRWDGKLPTFTGSGGVPMFNVGTLTK